MKFPGVRMSAVPLAFASAGPDVGPRRRGAPGVLLERDELGQEPQREALSIAAGVDEQLIEVPIQLSGLLPEPGQVVDDAGKRTAS